MPMLNALNTDQPKISIDASVQIYPNLAKSIEQWMRQASFVDFVKESLYEQGHESDWIAEWHGCEGQGWGALESRTATSK